MSPEYRNIYQIPREAAGITQERAAELIGTSVESLRAYEYGKRIPPDWAVIKMIEIYGAPYLAYQDLKNRVEVGKELLPDLEVKELPAAILKLLKEVNDFIKLRDELIDITSDGIIDLQERERFKVIMEQLDEVTQAILSLKFAKSSEARKSN